MKRALIPAMLLLAMAAGVAQGSECKGVSFPDKVEVDSSTLLLNGLGVRQATAFKVNVYVGALYFAKAFLSIWLGVDPPNPELKAGLLGGTCG